MESPYLRVPTLEGILSSSISILTGGGTSKVGMAERVGFEPTVELPRQQFSRLPDSAALAPLRFGRSSAGLSIEQVGTACPMGVPSLPCYVTFCNGLGVSHQTASSRQLNYVTESGNDNSVNSACSIPRLTREAISSMRSTLSTSSRRVLVLG